MMRGIKQGRESERRVEQILSRLRQQGIISNFIRSKSNDADDTRGVDFRIFVKQYGKTTSIPLQVKSSSTLKKKHKEKYPKIPVVSVRGKNTMVLREEIETIIYKFIAKAPIE